jgi:hypothetical protein
MWQAMARIPIDSEQFNRKLAEILDRRPASYLLTVPGVYEILAEEYNSQVISELWNKGRGTK